MLTQQKIILVMERFKAQMPNPKCELDYINPFTLLVSVVLSAQATDKSVNQYTKPLYQVASTPQQMIELGQEKLIEYIKPIGLWKNKSKNIIQLSQEIIQKFNGQVPHDREKLMSLPGVGRKTANVVLNVIWHEHTMPVDTHILRIAPKIGLAQGTTPEQIEHSLLARIPDEYLEHAHHWLILHGRYICTARTPNCQNCPINDLCEAGKG